MRRLIVGALALGLIAIAGFTAPAYAQEEFCSGFIPVSANGVFSDSQTCPDGTILLSGGYTCIADSLGTPLPVIVSKNQIFGYPTPDGWEIVGQTLQSAETVTPTYACVNKSSGEVKIVSSCVVGTNNSPCHNNDVCTNLSGETSQPQPPGAACEVCVNCEPLS